MTVLRRSAALLVLIGVAILALTGIAMPLIGAFADQREEIRSLETRLANLSRPAPEPDVKPQLAADAPTLAFLEASNTEQAGAVLGSLAATLLGPEATLISAVPGGSSTTQLFIEERFDLAAQMPETALAAFISRVENAKPTLRFARLGIRRSEQHGLVIVEASLTAFRQPDTSGGPGP